MSTISEVTFECEKLETETYNASKLTVTATNVDSDILGRFDEADVLASVLNRLTAFEILDNLDIAEVIAWLETRGHVVS